MPITRITRSGFSLVEMLVVLAVITLLVALLLPVLQNARRSAWTAQCSVKQRTIGMASMGYSIDYRGFFPLAFYSRHNGATVYVAEYWPITGGYENYMQLDPKDKSWDGPFMCPAYANDGLSPRSTITSQVVLNRSYSVARSLGQYRENLQTPDVSPWLRAAHSVRRLQNPAETAWLVDGTPFNATRLNYAGDAEIMLKAYGPYYGPMNRHAGGTNNLLFTDGHVRNYNEQALTSRITSLWFHRLP